MIARRNIFLSVVVVVCLLLTGCSSQSLREAQGIVSEADSLRAEGQGYTDSVAIAEAYNTLEKWQYLYPKDYVHACYHYGRLLRAKDDPVSAMEVFINGTHSRTRDYHILGRIYSNMGSISHLAGEYQLAYDMYSRSADMFLKNGDTLLYYYGLNEMAYQQTMLGQKEEALTLLNHIQQYCSDTNVLYRTFETTAELYKILGKYDNAIRWIDKTTQLRHISSLGIIIKAQSFSGLGKPDSALYYAYSIINDTSSIYQDKFNALYIIAHYDSTLSEEDIRDIASQREDIRYYEYEPEKEKLSGAINLLQQYITHKSDIRWIYILVAALLFIISSSILSYMWLKRKQHRHIVKELHEKEKVHTQLQKTITNLSQLHENQHLQIQEDVEHTCLLLHNSSDLLAELKWYNYEEMCSVVNLRLYGIIDRLNAYSLSEKEIRLCVLILLRASTQQMVDMIPYAYSGLGKFKYTTARKLGTNTTNLRTYILNLIG